MDNANQRALGMMQPVTAGNASPPVAAAAAQANQPAPAAPKMVSTAFGPNAPTTPAQFKKFITLGLSVLAESGAGFGVGAMLAKDDNVTATSLLVAAASLIFAFDVALRYIPTVANAAAQKSVLTWALIGTVVLSAVALIPYTIMKKKGKGKAPAAAVPTMAGLWIVGALLFTLLAAKGGGDGHMQGALQGSIISIMYMALASIGGYNMQKKQAGTGTFAGALWALLAMFDLLGLSRTKP